MTLIETSFSDCIIAGKFCLFLYSVIEGEVIIVLLMKSFHDLQQSNCFVICTVDGKVIVNFCFIFLFCFVAEMLSEICVLTLIETDCLRFCANE